jgi:hypothetical protein
MNADLQVTCNIMEELEIDKSNLLENSRMDHFSTVLHTILRVICEVVLSYIPIVVVSRCLIKQKC